MKAAFCRQTHPLIIHISAPWSCSVTSHCYVIEVCFRTPDGKKFPRELCVVFLNCNFNCLCNHKSRPCVCSHLLNIHGPSLDSSSHSEIRHCLLLQCRKNEGEKHYRFFLLMFHCCQETRKLNRRNLVICMTLGAASLISLKITHSDSNQVTTQYHSVQFISETPLFSVELYDHRR